MKVDKYISDLLLEHDCVIIPNFGGFVANIAPATIHPSQHVFSPPSKEIVFNKNLKRNDGLLAHHISIALQKEYSEACEIINSYVAEIVKKLQEGERVNIDKVGVLYFDIEQNIQFDPDKAMNYLLDSFGLSSFHSLPVKRENYQHRIQKQFIDRKPIPAERKKINVKRLAALAIAIPFFMMAVWIPLKTDLLRHVNYSSLNPFIHETNAPAHHVAKSVEPAVTKSREVGNEDIKAAVVLLSEKNDTLGQTTKSFSSVTEYIIADQQKEEMKYHIIGGCFTIKDNAEKFQNTLQQKGYASSILDNNDKFFRVRYNSYSKKSDALVALAKIRSSNPEAWLLVK